MTNLFDPIRLRGLQIANRVWLPPMCQYQAVDGVPNDWHHVHYGSRAAGGFGLVVAEASGVVPEGRISPQCTGLWNDEQQDAWADIVSSVHKLGARMGIQLNHAGRKGSSAPMLPNVSRETVPPERGGWEPVAPSPVASSGLAMPRELSDEEVAALPDQFADAALRAVGAGFDTVQIHGAHGYLLHQFLSPLSNRRTDRWGGDFDGRTRLLVETVKAVREVLPESMPLMLRISATEWVTDEPSWDLEQSVELADLVKHHGVDLIDVSTGGNVRADIPAGPNYQVEFAAALRKVGVPTAAVGLITEARQADSIVEHEFADAVNVGRSALRDPYWPRRAAEELGVPLSPLPSYYRGG